MRNHNGSMLVIGLLALTMTACSGAPSNTDACRDLLNVQGELETLVNEVSVNAGEIRTVLPRFVELADAAKSIDADGDVKTAATSLGDAAGEWHDALEVAAEEDALDDPIDSSLAAAYIEADLGVRNACSQFLP